MTYYIGDYHRIVCTMQEPNPYCPYRSRIVAVGVSDGESHATRPELSVEEVVHLMRQGVLFYTKGEKSGKTAMVNYYHCSKCNQYHIRSAADAVKDNNLDELRVCVWSSAA